MDTTEKGHPVRKLALLIALVLVVVPLCAAGLVTYFYSRTQPWTYVCGASTVCLSANAIAFSKALALDFSELCAVLGIAYFVVSLVRYFSYLKQHYLYQE